MALLSRRDAGVGYSKLVEDTKKALELVRNILSSNKSPRVLETSEPHLYEDKYSICEFLSNVSLNAIFGLFELIGLDSERLQVLRDKVQTGEGITMRFVTRSSCDFVDEYEAKREMMTHVVEYDAEKKDTTAFNPSFPFITKKTQQNASVET